MSLKEISTSRFATLICEVRPLDNVESVIQVAKYVHQLPINLIDDLFTHLVDTNDECLSSNEIAVLLHPQKRKLIIDDLVNANGSCFDVQFMLDVGGSNMTNLTELQLPVACSLPSTVCEQLCLYATNLRILNLYCVQVCDDSMQFVARLHLEELNLNYTSISDFGATQLCDSHSNLKKSLRIIRTYGTRMSARGHTPILELMPNLEDVDSNYSTLTLLRFLSSSYEQPFSTLALRRLRTTPIRPNVVTLEDVQFAFKTCPRVEQVELERLDEPKAILTLLPLFTNLSRLELRLDDSSNYSFERFLTVLRTISEKLTELKITNFPSTNEEFEQNDLSFPKLENLSLTDHKSFPVSSELLVCCLATCYQLKCLRLSCRALTDEVVVQFLLVNPFTGLNCLSISNCPNLSILGAVRLLQIPSLSMVTLMDSLSREQQEELFSQVDVDKLNLFCADRNLYF